VHLRQKSVHELTRQLVDTYGEIVTEDLDIAAMQRSMGGRAFRRAASDNGLGALRDKAERSGLRLVVADRLFPSSKLHHGCGGMLVGPKLAKILTCEAWG
jgi:putative transposase